MHEIKWAIYRCGTAAKFVNDDYNYEHYWPLGGNKKQDPYYMIVMTYTYDYQLYNIPCQQTSCSNYDAMFMTTQCTNFVSLHHIPEVGICIKAVHVTGHYLMAECIVSLRNIIRLIIRRGIA